MTKIIGWILGFTKVAKVFLPIQQFLSGKKSYLAGAAIAVPALITIVLRFADQGMAYLLVVTGSPEWTLFMNGLAIMGIRAAITKAADPATDPNVSSTHS